jgi:hypothetical protein
MAANLIPYGQLADGSFGIPYSNTGVPLASVIEVLASLPSTSSTDNFPGRTVFQTSDKKIYVFSTSPNAWTSLTLPPVTIGSPIPSAAADQGSLYYATSVEILYIYIGTSWIGIAGKMGSGVIWRHYVGDSVTSLFATGSNQGPPVEYVQV